MSYRIYMDVCCLNRPFDDNEQPDIYIPALVQPRFQVGQQVIFRIEAHGPSLIRNRHHENAGRSYGQSTAIQLRRYDPNYNG